MTAPEPRTLGKYVLLKKLATGGMGEVFLAKLLGPSGFAKLVVIKRILPHHAENTSFVEMFFAEARVAAQLTHSNIAQTYEMDECDGSLYIAMEFVHGKSLHEILESARRQEERLPPGLAIDVVSQLCAGLSCAHNARDLTGKPLAVVHRDVHPRNILVTYNGEVKLIDFGIARSEVSTHSTAVGTIKGSFAYMSPEQSAAERLDKRSDVFSTGICLYETVSLLNPFSHPNTVQSLVAIQTDHPPPLADIDPSLAPFDPIVSKALAKKPEQRYQDCSELRAELVRLLDAGQVPKSSTGLAEYVQRQFSEQMEAENNTLAEISGVHEQDSRAADTEDTSATKVLPRARPPLNPFGHPSRAEATAVLATDSRPIAKAEAIPSSGIPHDGLTVKFQPLEREGPAASPAPSGEGAPPVGRDGGHSSAAPVFSRGWFHSKNGVVVAAATSAVLAVVLVVMMLTSGDTNPQPHRAPGTVVTPVPERVPSDIGSRAVAGQSSVGPEKGELGVQPQRIESPSTPVHAPEPEAEPVSLPDPEPEPPPAPDPVASPTRAHRAKCSRRALNRCVSDCRRAVFESCLVLARALLAGQSAPMDAADLAGTLRQVCARGEGPACAHANGLEYLLRCNRKDRGGCLDLGDWHREGKGGKRSSKVAAPFYRKACRLGSGDACFALGEMYEATNRKSDLEKAIDFYEKACRNRSPAGCTMAARLRERSGVGRGPH